MEQVKDHLNPGGIYLFNATGSNRAEKTAATVFPDAALLLNPGFEDDLNGWITTGNAAIRTGVAQFKPDLEEYRKELQQRVDDLAAGL